MALREFSVDIRSLRIFDRNGAGRYPASPHSLGASMLRTSFVLWSTLVCACFVKVPDATDASQTWACGTSDDCREDYECVLQPDEFKRCVVKLTATSPCPDGQLRVEGACVVPPPVEQGDCGKGNYTCQAGEICLQDEAGTDTGFCVPACLPANLGNSCDSSGEPGVCGLVFGWSSANKDAAAANRYGCIPCTDCAECRLRNREQASAYASALACGPAPRTGCVTDADCTNLPYEGRCILKSAGDAVGTCAPYCYGDVSCEDLTAVDPDGRHFDCGWVTRFGADTRDDAEYVCVPCGNVPCLDGTVCEVDDVSGPGDGAPWECKPKNCGENFCDEADSVCVQAGGSPGEAQAFSCMYECPPNDHTHCATEDFCAQVVSKDGALGHNACARRNGEEAKLTVGNQCFSDDDCGPPLICESFLPNAPFKGCIVPCSDPGEQPYCQAWSALHAENQHVVCYQLLSDHRPVCAGPAMLEQFHARLPCNTTVLCPAEYECLSDGANYFCQLPAPTTDCTVDNSCASPGDGGVAILGGSCSDLIACDVNAELVCASEPRPAGDGFADTCLQKCITANDCPNDYAYCEGRDIRGGRQRVCVDLKSCDERCIADNSEACVGVEAGNDLQAQVCRTTCGGPGQSPCDRGFACILKGPDRVCVPVNADPQLTAPGCNEGSCPEPWVCGTPPPEGLSRCLFECPREDLDGRGPKGPACPLANQSCRLVSGQGGLVNACVNN